MKKLKKKVKKWFNAMRKHKHVYVFRSVQVDKVGKYTFRTHILCCEHCNKTKRIAV